MKISKLTLPLSLIIMLSISAYAIGGNVNVFTLPNGIKVIHKQSAANPLVTIQLFLRGGVISEKPDQAGLANFTQVIMLKSTKNRNAEKLASDIESIGASLTSYADYDYSSLGISMTSEFFGKGAELLSDIYFHPDFNEREIEMERANALASLESRKDLIFHAANDAFNRDFYGEHPYSWPEIGKAETISKFSKKDMAAWHGSFYLKGAPVIIIIGDVALEQAKAAAQKYFGALSAAKAVHMFPASAPGKPAPKQEIVKSKKFRQAYLMIGYPAPPAGNNDYAALKVINSLLGSRMSGRLFTELREKLGLGYEVNSFYPSRLQLSRFVVYLGLEQANLELAKTKILEILADLVQNPVSDKELTETKNFIKGIYALEHQTISRQAWYFGWWEIMGMGYDYDAKYLDSLMNVTPADLQAAAERHFTDDFVQIEVIPE